MRALGEWSEWLTLAKVQFLQLCFDSEQIDEHPSASAKKVDGLHTSDIISSTRLFGDSVTNTSPFHLCSGRVH